MDCLADRLAARFGYGSKWGGSGLVDHIRDGLRFQLIWRAPEHYNHVHFGDQASRRPRVLMTPLAPVFIPNSREPWWPVPVEACARARATLVRPAGGQKFLNPRDLQDLPDGGYLNFPADMRQPLDEPVTGYMRIKVGRPLTWVAVVAVLPLQPQGVPARRRRLGRP